MHAVAVSSPLPNSDAAAVKPAADCGLEMGASSALSPAATAAMRSAIRRGEIHRRFRPCIRLAGRRLVLAGAELVAGWSLPIGAPAMGSESNGFVSYPWNDWALFQRLLWLAHQAQYEWSAAGTTVPALLTFSARFLAGGSSAGFFDNWLTAPANCLPVTLQLRVRDLDTARLPFQSNVAQLRHHGYQVAMQVEASDLWGMRNLARWPADEIILSPALTQALVASRDLRRLTKAMMHAARAGQMQVRATGVQNREALQATFDLGVTRFQGDFISGVLPQSALLGWSHVHRRLAA